MSQLTEGQQKVFLLIALIRKLIDDTGLMDPGLMKDDHVRRTYIKSCEDFHSSAQYYVNSVVEGDKDLIQQRCVEAYRCIVEMSFEFEKCVEYLAKETGTELPRPIGYFRKIVEELDEQQL